MDFEGLDNHDNPHPQGGRRGPTSQTIGFTMNSTALDNHMRIDDDPHPQGGRGGGPLSKIIEKPMDFHDFLKNLEKIIEKPMDFQ